MNDVVGWEGRREKEKAGGKGRVRAEMEMETTGRDAAISGGVVAGVAVCGEFLGGTMVYIMGLGYSWARKGEDGLRGSEGGEVSLFTEAGGDGGGRRVQGWTWVGNCSSCYIIVVSIMISTNSLQEFETFAACSEPAASRFYGVFMTTDR